MKYVWILVAACLLTLTACFYEDHGYRIVENPAALDYAIHHLPHTGVLHQNPDGFVYLKVSNAYIHALYPRLHVEGFHKPPYFRRPHAPGAHISVIYSDEMRGRTIAEIGQSFTFKPLKLALIGARGHTQYIILEVESPELEALRRKYGLTSKLKNHDYHITLAKRVLRG